MCRLVKLSAFESAADSPLQMGRWHHDGELAVAQSGLDHVIIRPQYFMQNLAIALRDSARTGVFRHAAAPGVQLGVVDVADVAGVAAVLLTEPGHEGELVRPTGPAALSFDDMAAELSTATGTVIRYEQRSRDEMAGSFRDRGWPEWHIDDFFKIHGEAASPTVTSAVEDVTGAPPASFAAFLDGLLLSTVWGARPDRDRLATAPATVAQARTSPPSITSVWPVMNSASSESRNEIAPVRSSGSPLRLTA